MVESAGIFNCEFTIILPGLKGVYFFPDVLVYMLFVTELLADGRYEIVVVLRHVDFAGGGGASGKSGLGEGVVGGFEALLDGKSGFGVHNIFYIPFCTLSPISPIHFKINRVKSFGFILF